MRNRPFRLFLPSTSAPAALRWAHARSQQESARTRTQAREQDSHSMGSEAACAFTRSAAFWGNVTDQNDPRDAPTENNARARTHGRPPPPSLSLRSRVPLDQISELARTPKVIGRHAHRHPQKWRVRLHAATTTRHKRLRHVYERPSRAHADASGTSGLFKVGRKHAHAHAHLLYIRAEKPFTHRKVSSAALVPFTWSPASFHPGPELEPTAGGDPRRLRALCPPKAAAFPNFCRLSRNI